MLNFLQNLNVSLMEHPNSIMELDKPKRSWYLELIHIQHYNWFLKSP